MKKRNISRVFISMWQSFYCLAGLLLIPFVVPAQLTHLTDPYPASAKVNFVRTWTALKPISNAQDMINNNSLREVQMSTDYFDGLGRPLQTVVKKGSLISTSQTEPVDLIITHKYDEFGRERYKFLPSAAIVYAGSGSLNDGEFKYNPLMQQHYFYSSYGSPVYGQNESMYYSKTNFEPSPLNRVTEAYSPGNSWVGSESNTDPALRKNIQAKYCINTIIDDVKVWNVTNNTSAGFGTYATTSSYAEGQLYKNITIDENKKQVIEFKDKEGKVILKKVQLTSLPDDGTGSGYDGWLCTYYIYDDLNNLRCVIQPTGVQLLKDVVDWNLNFNIGELLNEQCFRYEYDQRNHIVLKKVPGAAEVYMLYDNKDRLVMTQDGNQRTTSKWLVIKYDNLNRPESTYLITESIKDALTLFNEASSSPSYPNLSNYPAAELLTQTGYDDYGSFAAYKDFDNSDIAGNTIPSSNSVYPYAQPLVASSAIKGMITWTQTKVLGTTSTYLATLFIYDDKGRIIQTKLLNVTGGIDIVTTQYNWAGQPLVVVQKQQNAGASPQTNIIVTQLTYDDLNRVIKTEKKISNTLVNNGAMPAAFTTISTVEYDALGQLKKKLVGSKKNPATNNYYTPRQPLQELVYDYNIRGWLLGINRDYLVAEGQTSDGKYFGFELGYDKETNKSSRNFASTLQYNGNITGMVWKSDGDDIRRKYDFSYDAANRLMKGDFEQQNSDNHAWNNTKVNYSVKMGDGALATTAYDANGNIKAMKQWGLKLTGSSLIDDLSYNYYPGSNQLMNVIDAVNDNSTVLGDFRASVYYQSKTPVKDAATTTDYQYDNNGNLRNDYNKDISEPVDRPDPGYLPSGIKYNYLNLPETITILRGSPLVAGSVKGVVKYLYDALGNKLRKTITDNTTAGKTITTTTNYLSGFVYESKSTSPLDANNPNYTDVLQFVPQEEGRVRFKPAVLNSSGVVIAIASLQYDYFIKDHLGNVRMVLTEEVQEDKYPVASLEPTKVATEKSYYDIKDAQVVDKATATGITNYINDNGIGNNPTDAIFSATNSTKLYQLNSNTARTGLGITLKVMAGDKIDVFGKSYYFTNTSGTGGNSTIPVLDLLAAFLNAPSAVAATSGHGLLTPKIINTPAGITSINSMITQQTSQSNTVPNKPRAFINVIFFDEQFKSVDFKISMVGNNSVVKDHFTDLQNLVATKSGYVYIYCSNESPVNVFFDNLQVVQKRSPILEETHYYPFGLTMGGISSKAAGKSENKNKYQQYEFNNDFDINLYESFYRTHDPQLGRFWQVDPKPTESESPYVAMGDNPIGNVDPNGDYFFGLFGSTSEQRKGARAFAAETGGEINNITSKNVSVSYVKTINEKTGDAAVGSTHFHRDGFAKVYGSEAHQVFKTQSWALEHGTGRIDPQTGAFQSIIANGQANMVDDPITMLGPALLRGLFMKLASTAATSLAVTSTEELAATGIQANRTAGNLFRDELAEALRAEGRTVETEVFKRTPFGKRYMDLDVWKDGVNLGGIETKVGGSRYLPLQKLKDAWLGANGYPVTLVRMPSNW